MIEQLIEKALELITERISKRGKEQDARRDSVQQLQIACDTRAVYTAVHAQIDITSMFAALSATRRKLQQLKALFTEPQDQQRVADIIGDLDIIERQQKRIDSDWDTATKTINTAKTRIILAVRTLSDAVGLPYALPRGLTQELFFQVLDATAPASRDAHD